MFDPITGVEDRFEMQRLANTYNRQAPKPGDHDLIRTCNDELKVVEAAIEKCDPNDPERLEALDEIKRMIEMYKRAAEYRLGIIPDDEVTEDDYIDPDLYEEEDLAFENELTEVIVGELQLTIPLRHLIAED